MKKFVIFAATLLAVSLLWAQNAPMVGIPQGGGVDLANASKARPTRSGSALPSTCEVGELFFRTGVSAGQNLYGCTAADVWTVLGGSAGPAASRFPQSLSLGGYVVVTNVGASYDTVAQSKGLGAAEIDFAGVTSAKFTVFVNKVGSGTQSWQLYDESSAAQLALVEDTGASGDKTLTVTVNSGLPAGVARVRVRAKSTTAADDPVFYGASVLLQ